MRGCCSSAAQRRIAEERRQATDVCRAWAKAHCDWRVHRGTPTQTHTILTPRAYWYLSHHDCHDHLPSAPRLAARGRDHRALIIVEMARGKGKAGARPRLVRAPPDLPAVIEPPVRKGPPSSASCALVEDIGDLSDDNHDDRRYSIAAVALASLSLGGELRLFCSHKTDGDCLWCIETTDLAIIGLPLGTALCTVSAARAVCILRPTRARTSPRSLSTASRCTSLCSRPSCATTTLSSCE